MRRSFCPQSLEINSSESEDDEPAAGAAKPAVARPKPKAAALEPKAKVAGGEKAGKK